MPDLNIIKTNNKIYRVFIIFYLFCLEANAHHSFASTFDETSLITMEGFVDSVKYANPHVLVYFLVEDDEGNEELWYAESGSPITLRNINWNRDTISQGDYIRITGYPSRNGARMIGTQSPAEHIKFINPSTGEIIGELGGEVEDASVTNMPLQLADGTPNFSGYWAGLARRDETGRLGRARDSVPFHDFNEEAAELQAMFDPKDDPQVWCEPPGLVRQAAFGPHPVHIEQYEDRVIISYEEYAGRRVIYFDKRDVVGGEHSHLGQSWARYDDQKLIIESSHLLPNLAANVGYLLSDQTTTIETYYRNDLEDGRAVLMMSMEVKDPVNLLSPVIWSWGRYAASNYEFTDVVCEKPLTN
jgi:hypothetical protein